MKIVPVSSSNIAGIGYDPDRKELRVAFKNGAVHDHVDVPSEVHSRLMAADSHGKHYHQHIKGQYAARKMGGVAPEAEEPQSGLDAAIRRFRGE